MATIDDVLDQVDGLRRDAADRVLARFSSVSDLATASTEQLTAIKGIGAVMADRIQAAATASLPTARAQATRAASAADRTADVAAEQARRGTGEASSADASSDRGIVERVVDTAVDGARVVIEHTPARAKRLVGRAAEPVRRLVDRVTRRS